MRKGVRMDFLNNLLKNFLPHIQEEEEHQDLLQQIRNLLPTLPPEETLKIYCFSGLLARIAYNDLIITNQEKQQMQQLLQTWYNLTPDTAQKIVQLTIDHLKTLAGLDNHRYCSPLIELLSEEQRYNMIVALFQVARSDGQLSSSEQEEIRGIATALGLPHRHFVAARSSGTV